MLAGFTWIDWAVVAGLLVLTTVVGGRASGKQASFRDFFLGGRKLPWYAVSASIVATEISAVTFVSLPFVVFREGGDVTYLQLGIFGSLIARIVVGWVLVPAYYEREIASPYDYMGDRLGPRVRTVATALFTLGGVLAQSCRVYLTALVLEVVLHDELGRLSAATGVPSAALSVALIGVVAVVWTWMGGIATVVWTDAILFLVFVGGLLAAFATVALRLEGGAAEILASAREAGKLRFFDFDTDPGAAYTMWTAVLAATWMNVGALGTDQLMAQRMFCCRGPREARKAILGSYVGMAVTVLAALVGMALYAWYREHPLEGEALALYEANGDRIFPIFALEVLPAGLRGLIVAGVFAAAISSLDSILAALGQTTLSATWLPARRRALGLAPGAPLPPREERRTVLLSRGLVLAFGLLLCACALGVRRVHEHYPSVLDLALAMATYTWGALLAGFVLAFSRRRAGAGGFPWSAPLSVLAVFAVVWHAPWAQRAAELGAAAVALAWVAARLRPSVAREAGRALRQSFFLALGLALVLAASRGLEPGAVAWPWNVPIGFAVAWVWGHLLDRPSGVA